MYYFICMWKIDMTSYIMAYICSPIRMSSAPKLDEESATSSQSIKEQYLVSKALAYGTLKAASEEVGSARKITSDICSILVESDTPPLTNEEARTLLFRVCQCLLKRNMINDDVSTPEKEIEMYTRIDDSYLINLVHAETEKLQKYNKRLDAAAELFRASDDSLTIFANLINLFM